ALTVENGDRGPIEGVVPAWSGAWFAGVRMDSVEMAAEVDRIGARALAGRVEGYQRTPERRQVDAELAGESGEPDGAPKAFLRILVDRAAHGLTCGPGRR